MFVLLDKEKQKNPIKIWLENIEQLEEGGLEQAINLTNLPFIHKWVALMPDTHQGIGMPIGGVIATKDVIIPNAVGVDIGCGMAYVDTNIHRSEMNEEAYKNLVGQIMRNIPTGFSKHNKIQQSKELDLFYNKVKDGSDFEKKQKERHKKLWNECFPNSFHQLGTLGGGNHFIEIQEDECGMLGIMLHSGSRNMGKQIAQYFNNIAVEFNKSSYITVPKEFNLAFLLVNSIEGQDYIEWMNVALDFAMYNRQRMLEIVKCELKRKLPHIEFSNEVNAHHNYVNFENHYGENVWVHRKGAIRVGKGMKGIIPGAMGSYSYIVEGLGNEESFHSCSHGAGRKLSRKQAMKKYSVEETMLDMKKNNVILGKNKKSDISEESRFVYKDIDFVISQELDLVKPIKKLKTLCVIKG